MEYIPALRRTSWEVAASLLLALLTLIGAVILLFGANGYVVDFKRLTIEQAGLIVVRPSVRSAMVSLPSEAKTKQLGQEYVAQLLPGRYDVTVSAPGRTTWSRIVEVQPGTAAVYGNVTLFYAEPELAVERTADRRDLDVPLVDESILVRDGELLVRTPDGLVLVSRFSKPIRAARFLDAAHIVYLIGSDVHIIDLDGRSDVAFAGLCPTGLCRFRIEDNAKTLTLVQALTARSYRIQ
ncbi:MAG: hypothetical protein ACOYBJ_00365 [Patescibacteria group bacterium]